MHAVRLFRPDDPPSDNVPMGPTVKEIIDRYLVSCEKNAVHGAKASVERRRALFGFAAIPVGDRLMGDLLVSECLPHYLSDWIESNPSWKSSSTRKGKANTINAAFNWALKGKRIADNPFSGVNYEEAEPRPPLPDKVLSDLTDRCSKPFEELALFLRLTSRRLSEICDLEWEHIDWKEGTARVKKHKNRKRTKKDQVYVLVPEAIALLEKIRHRHPEPVSGHVFRNNKGTKWNAGTAGQYLRRLKRRLGVNEKATLHGIRHQAITAMIKNGATIKAAALQAGHSDTRITEKVYCHMEDAYDAMKDAVRLGLKTWKAPEPPTEA